MLYLFYCTECPISTTNFTALKHCGVTFKIVTWPMDQSDCWKVTWGIIISIHIRERGTSYCMMRSPCRICNSSLTISSVPWRISFQRLIGKSCWTQNETSIFLKSAWRHSVYDYYDKARNTPYSASWHLGDSLGVYRWPEEQAQACRISCEIIRHRRTKMHGGLLPRNGKFVIWKLRSPRLS